MSGNKLSIIVPIYNEEKVILAFYARVKSVLGKSEPDLSHEIIFVDDGSNDGSLALLKDLRRSDASVKILSFSRNFGHQFAITAGLDRAQGNVVAVIDGDLQDPPEVIPAMLEKWREGYEVVYGIRKKRKGENAVKVLTAKLFYRVIKSMSDTELPLDSGDFRLLDRSIVEALKSMREENRYIRGLISWVGYRQYGLLYERDMRYAGKTKYTFKKMIKFALDGILSFSDKPLKISAYLGFIFTIIAFLMGIRIIIDKIRYPQTLISGWSSLILAVLFMGGLQLISLGILGLYIGRQYREVKTRPLYIVAEEIGFAKDPERHA
jgi:glycosyltransferase involved in cell wall biosynthesis